jgi:adenine-specific DNA-methyltransferase
MKYMGSKRYMLTNGLGKLICFHAERASRVVDLFSGSGAISWFAAEHVAKPVLANDLQAFASILARSVVARTTPVKTQSFLPHWLRTAKKLMLEVGASEVGRRTLRDIRAAEGVRYVEIARERCAEVAAADFPITTAYGGYYYDPLQALAIDCLRKALPADEPAREVALASLISAASICVAAPGHTAQPLAATPSALPFLLEAWNRDVLASTARVFQMIASRYARARGEATTGDAFQLANSVREGDLVVVDPPYSNVQYSRFYHVLETIARGTTSGVSGNGRYPPREERPQSKYSLRSQASEEMDRLLKTLAANGAVVIMTFPAGAASNGLSGPSVREIASRHYRIAEQKIPGTFSTLGGNGMHRPGRQKSEELILVLSR